MKTMLPVNRAVANDLVSRLSDQILNGWDESLSHCLGNLDDRALIALHHGVAKSINGPLTRKQSANLYEYAKTLTRMHCGLFWKVFNFFHRELSEVWYLGSKKHKWLVFESLACTADKKSTEYLTQVLSLNTVFDYYMEAA
jgi:hypothetical protein